MSKPRLFLHIGHPKTGTTSIQTFLLANRALLKQRGVLYPETGLHDSAHRLLSTTHYAVSGRENRAPRVMQTLLAEIDASRCPVILLSCEGFASDNPATFSLFRDRFDTTVVYYIRRQDHMGESRYVQQVRAFFVQEARPPGLVIRDPRFHPDYLRICSLWAAVFGRDRLAVRVFERDSLVNRDLIDDFLHVAGLERTPDLLPPSSSNASLKRPYLAFKRHCNLLPLLDDEQRQLNRNLNLLSQADSGPALGHLLSPADRQVLIDSQRATNETIARDFLGRPDGVLFRDPPPSPADPWEPLRPLDPAEQVDLLTRLTPENRALIDFLHQPGRLAGPGEPVLPDLPDDHPEAFAPLAEKRTLKQLQRRMALLERRSAERTDPARP